MAEYKLVKGSNKPQIVPSGNWTLVVDGTELKKP